MIKSIQRIEFIEPTGVVTRLLDFGDKIEELIPVPVEQGVRHGAPTRALWGRPMPTGLARGEMAWARVRDHDSHAAAYGYCQRHGALMPINRRGILRVSIQDGEVWDHLDAVVTACVPVPLLTSRTYETLTQYRVEVGEKRPVSALAHETEHPVSWGVTPIEDCIYIIGGVDALPGWVYEGNTVFYFDAVKITIYVMLQDPFPVADDTVNLQNYSALLGDHAAIPDGAYTVIQSYTDESTLFIEIEQPDPAIYSGIGTDFAFGTGRVGYNR